MGCSIILGCGEQSCESTYQSIQSKCAFISSDACAYQTILLRHHSNLYGFPIVLNTNTHTLGNCECGRLFVTHGLPILSSHRHPPYSHAVICISQFEELFTPYTKYCLEQEGCQEYIKNKYRDNELFKTFVIVSIRLNQ